MNEKIKESLKSLEYDKDLFSNEHSQQYGYCGVYVGNDSFLTVYNHHRSYIEDGDEMYVINLGRRVHIEGLKDFKLFKSPKEAATFLFAFEHFNKLTKKINKYDGKTREKLEQQRKKIFLDFLDRREIALDGGYSLTIPYLEKEPDFDPLQIMSEEEFLAIVQEKAQEFSRLKERESKLKAKEEKKEEKKLAKEKRKEKSLYTKLKNFVKEYKDERIEKKLAKKTAKEEYDKLGTLSK